MENIESVVTVKGRYYEALEAVADAARNYYELRILNCELILVDALARLDEIKEAGQ